MARCDEGYECEVCHRDVDGIGQSDLYLRYVIGELDPEQLHIAKERHISCNQVLAQFIVDAAFPPIVVEGVFDKRQLDLEFVRQREEFVTRGWHRLQELAKTSGLSLLEYPLPDVQERLRSADLM